jgi:16S rRNA (uracil1498-N3)-methyltransferase
LEQVFLSNIELYYSSNYNKDDNTIILAEEEFYHAIKVMRNKTGDDLYITDGKGHIFSTIIDEIQSKTAILKTINTFDYVNKHSIIDFYIPNLRNSDRLEFALEKCTELGITNFIIYNSDRSVSKGCKLERLNKIVLAAMKQSLRAYLPKINFIEEIKKTSIEGQIVLLDQNSNINFIDYFNNQTEEKKYSIIIGPEGGFSDREYEFLKRGTIINIAPNRLRSETACVTCASLLNYTKLIL